MDGLSPLYAAADVRAGMVAIGEAHKAEVIGPAIQRSRSSVYAYIEDPGCVPYLSLAALARFHADGAEWLTRLAGYLLAEAAALAVLDHAAGHSKTVIRTFKAAMQQPLRFGGDE